MRARLVYIILAALVVGAIAALNWPEVMRTSHLNFGIAAADAPIGAILLAAFLLTLAVFLVSSVVMESRHYMVSNRHRRELEAQRDLAERAEASRFTDLRQHMDNTLRETRQRDSLASREFEKSMLQSHRELRTHLENMSRAMMARLAEIESRITGRAPVLERDPVVQRAPLGERVAAREASVEEMDARAAEARAEARAREDERDETRHHHRL